MPTYIGLYKFTAKGAGDIKKIPDLAKESAQTWEAMGGKTIAVLATMGRYDMVTVGEGPSDEMAATFAAGLAARGFVATETLRAFTMEECAALLAKLP
ncbi:MAG TPA: GYD domain-containing protein [Thermoleophilia bacterium]|nr:GYD domain-containing protein [Thermoleophilia bacterium]